MLIGVYFLMRTSAPQEDGERGTARFPQEKQRLQEKGRGVVIYHGTAVALCKPSNQTAAARSTRRPNPNEVSNSVAKLMT